MPTVEYPLTYIPPRPHTVGQGGIFLSKKSPIFYSALLLTGVNLLLRLAGTSFQVFISSQIGPAGIGLLQLVLSVSGMALTAGIAGIRTATMYLSAGELGRKKPENIAHILSGCCLYSILCSGAVGLLLYLFAPQIAAGWIGDIQSTTALRLVACFLPVNCLCGVMAGYFTAANRIRTLAGVEVLEQVVSILVSMGALAFWAKDDPGKACVAVVAGSGCGGCLTLILLTAFRIREHAPKRASFPLKKRITDTAIPLAVADDVKVGINTVENLIVPKRLGLYQGVADPLAVFGTVCGMVFPVLMFPACIVFSLAELLIPEMARCHASGSTNRIAYLAKQSLRITLLYSCVFSGFLRLVAEPVCLWLYDNADAGNYLFTYALLVPMLYCDSIIDAMNKGLGQQKISVRYNIFTAVMDVTFLFLLLPRYGMQGYFFSFLVTHLINFILSLRLLIKTANIRISIGTPVLTGVCLFLSIWLASFLHFPVLRCVAFFLLFISSLTLCRVVGYSDLKWLKALLKT